MKQIIGNRLLLIAILLSVAVVFEECGLRKNKCDGCPAYKSRGKKVKKSSKGSI